MSMQEKIQQIESLRAELSQTANPKAVEESA